MVYAIHPVKNASLRKFSNGKEFLVLSMNRASSSCFGFWKPPHCSILVPGCDCIAVRGRTTAGAVIIEFREQLYTRITREQTGYNGTCKSYNWGNGTKIAVKPYEGPIVQFKDRKPIEFN
jgi:hypothetical protein